MMMERFASIGTKRMRKSALSATTKKPPLRANTRTAKADQEAMTQPGCMVIVPQSWAI